MPAQPHVSLPPSKAGKNLSKENRLHCLESPVRLLEKSQHNSSRCLLGLDENSVESFPLTIEKVSLGDAKTYEAPKNLKFLSSHLTDALPFRATH